MGDVTNQTPEEARALLVAALRSGKYQQTSGYLHSENGYCCLGVACEVYIANGGQLDVSEGREDEYAIWRYSNEIAVLPEQVQSWLGFATEDGQLRGPAHANYAALTDANDKGETFEEIANLIESGRVELATESEDKRD